MTRAYSRAYESSEIKITLRAITAEDVRDLIVIDKMNDEKRVTGCPLWTEQNFTHHLTKGQCLGFVAFVGPVIAGYIVTRLGRPSRSPAGKRKAGTGRIHLVRLSIHPTWQRRGVGSCLLRRAKAMRPAGYEMIEARVPEEQLRSTCPFLNRHDFRATHMSADFREIVMRCGPLAASPASGSTGVSQ